MSPLVWWLELRVMLGRRRELTLWVLSPLALVVVIGTDAVSSLTAAACYAALFTSCGALRALLPLLRDNERGMTARVIRAGVSPGAYLVQRAAAAASVTLVQLLPSVVVAGALLHGSPAEVLVSVAALAIPLWVVGLIGVLAATASRRRAEALVLCGLTLLLLLHMSGVLRVPPTGGPGAALEEASPFRALHESFVAMVSGGTANGGVAGLAWAFALPVLVVALAPRLVATLTPRDDRRAYRPRP